ncbi:MAG: hypothetical protein H6541_01005 [Lentimicrobiaceae bacterium]|nr:hypothetical protein [Lentimicrobiaceae bacterium]MCB9022986.1 hypothetical protein [Lentimicrobiaceae bacterium]
MRHLFFLLVFLLNGHFLFAQTSQLQFLLQSGVSVPLSDFAGTNLETGSFALPGFSGAAEVKYVRNNHWGILIQGGLSLNPIDVGYLGYQKVQADPFLDDVYIRSDPFKIIHLVAGPSYLKRIGKPFLLEGQLMAGVFFASTPYQLYKAEYALIGPVNFEITASRDNCFAYGAGLRLIYEFNTQYQFGVATQYMQSRAEFGFLTDQGIRTDVRNISQWTSSFTLILKLYPK